MVQASFQGEISVHIAVLQQPRLDQFLDVLDVCPSNRQPSDCFQSLHVCGFI